MLRLLAHLHIFVLGIATLVEEQSDAGMALLQITKDQKRTRDAKEFKDYATPASPSRRLAASDWKAAAGTFVQIPARREGVEETIYAKPLSDDDPSEPGDPSEAAAQKCGTPCVAHCMAGQPRDFIQINGLWKSIKHRLIDQFSESPVVFALLTMGALQDTATKEGQEGHVREGQAAVSNEAVLPGLKYVGVDRALLLREVCQTGACLQEGLRLKCDAKDLGIKELVDEATGTYSNMCEIQVSRFRDALELVQDYEAEHGMKFDWVTRPRPDVYFTRPIIPARFLDANAVQVSPWAACGFGGMDWFYAVPRKHAETIGDFASSVSCEDYKSSPAIKGNCSSCPGCECWMAAWMFAKNIPFERLPWGWFTPSKFCGTDCPHDWDVNPKNVMGMDSRVDSMPCEIGMDSKLTCPVLIEGVFTPGP